MATTEQAIKPVTLQEYKGKVDPDWCPGCGDFGVLAALLLAHIRQVCSLVGPCDPGAAPGTHATIRWDGTLAGRWKPATGNWELTWTSHIAQGPGGSRS